MGPCCCSLHQRRGKQVQAMLTRCFLDDSCMACSTALSSSRPDELSDPCGRVWQDFVASTLVVPHFPGSDTVSDSRTWQHCFDTLLACLLANFASPGTSITHETTVKPFVDVFCTRQARGRLGYETHLALRCLRHLERCVCVCGGLPAALPSALRALTSSPALAVIARCARVAS